MVEDNKPNGSDDLFNQLSNIVPAREIPVSDENVDDGEAPQGHKSFTERSEENPNLSDMQAFDKRLFPDLGKKHLNVVAVSRVFPDIYNPFLRMLVKDLLMEDGEMSMTEAVAFANTSLSTGIDGEGRIDILGLAGISNTRAVEEDKAKLGLI